MELKEKIDSRHIALEKIGEGWQYMIYDLGNERVLKKWRNSLFKYHIIYSHELFLKRSHPFLKTIFDIHRVYKMGKEAVLYIKKILPLIDKNIIGNPVFINKYDYEQDKVFILKNVLALVSVEDGKKILDDYVKLIFTTWQYGFSDAMYNFLNNNGLNKNGKVIQIDFGELIFNKDEVQTRIINKRWLGSSSFVAFPECEIKIYYKNIMEENMTLKNLEKYWKMLL